MSVDTSLALLRIELKLDLLLASAAAHDPALAELLASGDALARYSGDLCPACSQTVRVVSNLHTEEYVRSCGCRPPLPIVAGVAALTTPIIEKKPAGVADDSREDRDEGPDPTTTSSRPSPVK